MKESGVSPAAGLIEKETKVLKNPKSQAPNYK
jgi:hypothetical protein